MVAFSLRRSPPRAPRFRPHLESLEDRAVPATVLWVNPSGGDWDVGSNWSTGQVPTKSDRVVVALPGVTITHSQNVADSVRSISGAQGLVVSGGSLNITNSFTLNQLTLSGGELTLGSSSGSKSANLILTGAFTWTGGVLDGAGNVAANGDVAITGPSDHTLDGLTLDAYGATTWTGGNILAANSALIVNESGADVYRPDRRSV